VTEDKSPGDRLLELVVFGPAGLAVTIVEEFPKLVEKGRHRVEGQVHTARLVGQFAVQMGRRQLEQSLGHLGARRDHVPEHDADDDDGDSGVGPRADVEAPAMAPSMRDEPEPVSERRRPPVWLGAEVGNGSGSPSSLAIPGYDSLSASQVVQRLEGLSSPELEEVRAHEAAHRQRQTILHRVEQLLAGGDVP